MIALSVMACGVKESRKHTAGRAGYFVGSSTWSLDITTGRESRTERNCFAKLDSVIAP
jgi:hypothetical protein